MRCNVCNNERQSFFCSDCINTSPKLLLKLRFELLALRATNNKLHSRVEEILESAFDHSHLDSNTEEGILASRLRKVELLKFKKRNNRINSSIHQLESGIDSKRKRIQELRGVVEMKVDIQQRTTDQSINEKIKSELNDRNRQLIKVLKASQNEKLKSLMEWFIIKKRDSFELPYTIAFKPLVSLRNYNKLPASMFLESIYKMTHYLEIASTILSCILPYDNEFTLRKIITCDIENIKANAMQWIARLIANIVHICKRMQLLPHDSIDIAILLEQYDIDGIFYDMATMHPLQFRPSTFEWTHSKILKYVSQVILSSSLIAATPPAPNIQYRTQFNLENNDNWFVVD